MSNYWCALRDILASMQRFCILWNRTLHWD